MMIGFEPYALQRSPSDERDSNSLPETVRRAMEQSECELCESVRYTDVEYEMEVCRPCQLEYLPE